MSRSLVLAVAVVAGLLFSPAGSTHADGPPLARLLPQKPAQATIAPGQSRERIHLKLKEGSGARLRDGALTSVTGRDLSALRSVLSQFPGTRVQRMFSRPEADLAADERRLEAKTGKDLADLNLWYLVTVGEDTDPVALIDALNALDSVEIAYPAPLPAPPPDSPDYEPLQGYLDPAPAGIGARDAWSDSGSRGAGVKVIDIEYSWNTTHEDLSKAAGALIPNGTPLDPFGNDNHGTAVLGELIADRNGFGVTGIAYEADLGLVNVANEENEYDLANAINLAQAATDVGDVILIEQQVEGPALPCPQPFDYAPVEYVQAYFDAIQTATAAGRVVVEPAGNGGCNLDHSAYGGLFDRSVRDSEAIIVGAGASGVSGCTTPARSRLWFSSYGERVDVQGWGECVVTTGYGTLQDGADRNLWYSDTFAGTSSASPIVAGAAAVVQGELIARGLPVWSPEYMRLWLATNGSLQDPAVPGNVGPLPNLLPTNVGGVQALPDVAQSADPAPTNSDTSSPPYADIAGLAAAGAVLTAGALYARRRRRGY